MFNFSGFSRAIPDYVAYREAREHLNLSPQQVADKVCIQLHQYTSIEADMECIPKLTDEEWSRLDELLMPEWNR